MRVYVKGGESGRGILFCFDFLFIQVRQHHNPIFLNE